MFPSERDIDRLTVQLLDRFRVPHKLLRKLFGDQMDRVEEMMRDFGQRAMSDAQLLKLIVRRDGAFLFAGSSEAIRELRTFLLKQLPEEQLVALYRANKSDNENITQPNRMVRPLVMKKWNAGKAWPRAFVEALGLPKIFAGVTMRSSALDAVQDIEPRKIVPPLVPFQQELKQQMIDVLNRERKATRCMISLPTGAGKTRVAVEAFIEWLQPNFSEFRYLIWIAQSEELCEQAIACISDMWQHKEFSEGLRVYRFFGGRQFEREQLTGGVVVASVQQLYHRLEQGDPIAHEFLNECDAMIIDEAHHAAARTYREIVAMAKGEFAICGLSATPGRGTDDTSELVTVFQTELIEPTLPAEYRDRPLEFFRAARYLARPIHRVVHSNMTFDLTIEDDDVAPQLLTRLAADEMRNFRILKVLQAIAPEKSTLVYACTVEHADYLAAALNGLGRKAVMISGETPKAMRRLYIDAYKRGELQFLVNYGVLTTGFDAPRTECIVITRPTTSAVLYEQIVGRGLRGPKFGGTKTCDIIDFTDNFRHHGEPLAYHRFAHFWSKEKHYSTK